MADTDIFMAARSTLTVGGPETLVLIEVPRGELAQYGPFSGDLRKSAQSADYLLVFPIAISVHRVRQ
jgi:hypothetical protein